MKSTFASQYTNFLEVLRQARTDQKLTQKNVAEILGCPQSFISKYENGERRLDVVEFFAIAKALNANPWEILKKAGLV